MFLMLLMFNNVVNIVNKTSKWNIKHIIIASLSRSSSCDWILPRKGKTFEENWIGYINKFKQSFCKSIPIF